MTESQDNQLELKPLPYHEGIRDYLKAEEPAVWNWYAMNRVRDDQAESVRFELLKSTYRIEREARPGLYEAAETVAKRLALDVPITIYQAQNPSGLNASLAYMPTEAHLVFQGPIESKLTGPELRALLGHELSHLLLWRHAGGDYIITDQVLAAMTNDMRAEPPYFASARLFSLYTEIYCDRGALYVVEDPLVVVSMLVKIQTELEDVSAESYLRQADEIFSKGKPKADQLTHPEAFIRARAIRFWAERDQDANKKIAAMIEGPPTLDELDLLAQQRIAAVTRRLMDRLLAPPWMRTDLTLAHARMFFDTYTPPTGDTDDQTLAADIKSGDVSMQNYFCYVLLDFVTADRDLEELPLAAALALCESLGLKKPFAEIARKELRLRKRQLEKLDREKKTLLTKATERVTRA